MSKQLESLKNRLQTRLSKKVEADIWSISDSIGYREPQLIVEVKFEDGHRASLFSEVPKHGEQWQAVENMVVGIVERRIKGIKTNA